MESIIKVALQIIAVIIFVTGSGQVWPSCQAQDRNPPKTITDDNDFEARSNTLRNISEHKVKSNAQPQPAPNPAQVMAEAREDYMAIQIVNRDLKKAVVANTPLDFKFVSTSVTEIRKRAERLNINLALPQPENGTEPTRMNAASNPDELKTSLLHLSDLIRSFVTNPCFRESSLVVNTETVRAKVDLENIIVLTKQLQKDSKQLEKASRQTNP